MIYAVNLTEQAEADLRNIYDYIAFVLLAPEAAKRQLLRLEGALLSLDEFPERYRRYEKEPWFSRGLRILPVDRYCVFYIVDAIGFNVNIIRVMYGARDIDKHLSKYTEM